MLDNPGAQLPITQTDAGHACSCCSTAGNDSQPKAAAAAPVTTTYGVEGMTCEHCVRSVTEELDGIPAVTGVDVALKTGGVSLVTVHSDTALDEAAVAAAIDDAGYRLVRA